MSKPISQFAAPDESVLTAKQHELDAFIKQTGERVLQARLAQGMSRRVLSERAGVSSRTIVLLETGTGNTSIALLFRIASALGHSVEWFLGQTSQSRHNAERVVDYYHAASPPEQQRVLNILAAKKCSELKHKRLCLIGLRGAGKSTLGYRLGKLLSMPFLELNNAVEELSGLSVHEVMNLYGQDGYRQFEQQSLEHCVGSNQELILAAAGGVVSNPDTHAYLLKHFHTIWLKAAPEEHMDRVKRQGDSRPMAGNPEAMAQLRSLLTTREPLYGLSDATVDTTGLTIETALRDLQQSARRILYPTDLN